MEFLPWVRLGFGDCEGMRFGEVAGWGVWWESGVYTVERERERELSDNTNICFSIAGTLVEFQFSFSHGCFCLHHAAQRLLGPSQTGTRFVRHESDSKIQVYCAEKGQKGKGCEEELMPPEQSRTASQFISL